MFYAANIRGFSIGCTKKVNFFSKKDTFLYLFCNFIGKMHPFPLFCLLNWHSVHLLERVHDEDGLYAGYVVQVTYFLDDELLVR